MQASLLLRSPTCSVIVFLLLVWDFDVISGDVGCRDKDNRPVDWFIVYKLPKLSYGPTKLIREGLGHLYMDVNRPEWVLSDVSLNISQQAVGYTVQQVYQNKKSKDVPYVLYNDEHPAGQVDFHHGHTKGVVAFDKETGFWLVHSLPHFPESSGGSYSYPHTGLIYGQMFLCITLPYKYLDTIGNLFLYNYPSIYDWNLPSGFKTENPHMAAVVNGKHVSGPNWNVTAELKTVAGQSFTAFAKYIKFDKDLYADWLAPHYETNLDTETWQNGPGNLPSRCNQTYKVQNNQQLYLQAAKVNFREENDHSKWAVGLQKTVTCIGDINRQEHQLTRAGGTVCFDIPAVHGQFQLSVQKVERC